MNKINSKVYDGTFYKNTRDFALIDGEQILSMVLDRFNPQSVVDFGCGNGTWLSVVKRINPSIEILGIDGDYVKEEWIDIPKEFFIQTDLSEKVSLNKKYDLAISTEVAEHIDRSKADVFIDNISNASDKVLFSAAIPGQGGTHHVNEQWQSYWVEKFVERGFSFDLSIRNALWGNSLIMPWRRQNILFFYKGDIMNTDENNIIDVVHPEMYHQKVVDSILGYYIKNPGIIDLIDKKIVEALEISKNVVIFPYGTNGKVCKSILNYKYGIQEIAIADNLLCSERRIIYSLEDIANMELNDYVIVDTCYNKEIHKTILDELNRFFRKEQVISVFEMN